MQKERIEPETPAARFTQIVTGHFHERRKYSVWRPLGTKDWLLIYTEKGRGRFGFPGGEIITEPGDLTLLRPATPHDYGLEPRQQKWDLLWAHFHPRPHWIDWLNWPQTAPALMHFPIKNAKLRHKIAYRFSDVHALATSARHRRVELAMNALEELLLWCDAINPQARQFQTDTRIQLAMDHMSRNMARTITLDSLADISGLSVSRLAHLFRQQTGTTPQQFLEQQRINRARQLLELTAKSIKEISREVGYDTPFYFSLRFKRQAGISPKGYRSRMR